METIELVNHRGGYAGAFHRCKSTDYNHAMIYDHIRNKGDVNFVGSEACIELVSVLKTIEKKAADGDVNLINRIIRNGGFIEYTKKLEAQL